MPRCWNFDAPDCKINRQGGSKCACPGENPNNCGLPSPPYKPGKIRENLAAGLLDFQQNQPPAAGGSGRLTGNDSATRSTFSAVVSLAVPFIGIWTLFVLIIRNSRARKFNFGQNGKARRLNFVFQPSFALGSLAFLLLTAITGSVLTAPVAVSAEKRDTPDRNLMLGAVNPSNEPVFKSAARIGGAGTTQVGAPVFDSAGNRYISGGFTGTVAENGTNILTATLNMDAFVAKYDSNNNLLWARQGSGVTGNASDAAAATAIEGMTALAIDRDDNVYVGGSFVKTLTLQGGANPNVTLTDAGGSGINYESFIAKYDPSGNLLWAKGGASGSPQNLRNLENGQNAIDRIVVDSAGGLFVTGFVAGNNFMNSPISVNGQTDIVLAKLDAATGAVVWKQIIGGADDDNGLDLEIDDASNLYIVGNYGSASITFPNGATFGNPDDPNDTLENSTNAFVAKFDAAGNNLWVNSLDNAETVGGSHIAVNGAGEIYLTGYFFDSATFGATTLTENESSSVNDEDETSLGGYIAKMDTDGNYLWAKDFGGKGSGVALDAAGRVYVVGVFWDAGVFGAGTANQETLASFDRSDSFVARYDQNGDFQWAKPIGGSGVAENKPVGNPSPEYSTENDYESLGIAYNATRGTMFVTNGFFDTVALDCLTLKTAKGSLDTYLAELSADNEPTSCRIWNGLDPAFNDWDAPANWNGGIIPTAGDSVYVPFTGNNDDAPTYNPANNVPLSNLTIADDRIFTLEKNINITNRLDLNGGYIDAGSNFTVLLGSSAQAASIADGRVLGKVQKQFAGAANFTFPVGTADGYSPVALSNVVGAGDFTVAANQGAYPNVSNLPANRVNRWWQLTNNGLASASVTFQYLDGDVPAGTSESELRAYRINNGAAQQIGSSADAANNLVTANGVTQFSPWTLAAPAAPTAATVSISGRIMSGRRAVSGARVTMTDQSGARRFATTNAFGYYLFADVAAGETYVFGASVKRFEFPAQVVSVNEDISDLNFTAR